jgi:hypothetical protein
VSRTPFATRARALAVEGPRLAVAFGEDGIKMYHAADPAAPRLTAEWNGARFAYDVSLAGMRMFVAAGPEGLYVLDVSGDPVVIGLARELGFAAAVSSFGQFTYILDRSTNSVRRIESEFE